MEIMSRGFVFYIPHIPLTCLLLPSGPSENLITVQHTLSCPQLSSFHAHPSLLSAFCAQDRPAEYSQLLHSHLSNWPGKGQHVLQLVHSNVQAGTRGLLKAISPGMHTVQAVPNPPSLPTLLGSLSFMYLLIIKSVTGIWGLFLSNRAELGQQVPKLLEKTDVK